MALPNNTAPLMLIIHLMIFLDIFQLRKLQCQLNFSYLIHLFQTFYNFYTKKIFHFCYFFIFSSILINLNWDLLRNKILWLTKSKIKLKLRLIYLLKFWVFCFLPERFRKWIFLCFICYDFVRLISFDFSSYRQVNYFCLKTGWYYQINVCF